MHVFIPPRVAGLQLTGFNEKGGKKKKRKEKTKWSQASGLWGKKERRSEGPGTARSESSERWRPVWGDADAICDPPGFSELPQAIIHAPSPPESVLPGSPTAESLLQTGRGGDTWAHKPTDLPPGPWASSGASPRLLLACKSAPRCYHSPNRCGTAARGATPDAPGFSLSAGASLRAPAPLFCLSVSLSPSSRVRPRHPGLGPSRPRSPPGWSSRGAEPARSYSPSPRVRDPTAGRRRCIPAARSPGCHGRAAAPGEVSRT